MSSLYVNSLAVTGYPQSDTAAMKEAGDRETTARKHFGTLWGLTKKPAEEEEI